MCPYLCARNTFLLNGSCSFSFQIPQIFSCPVSGPQPLLRVWLFASVFLFSIFWYGFIQLLQLQAKRQKLCTESHNKFLFSTVSSESVDSFSLIDLWNKRVGLHFYINVFLSKLGGFQDTMFSPSGLHLSLSESVPCSSCGNKNRILNITWWEESPLLWSELKMDFLIV